MDSVRSRPATFCTCVQSKSQSIGSTPMHHCLQRCLARAGCISSQGLCWMLLCRGSRSWCCNPSCTQDWVPRLYPDQLRGEQVIEQGQFPASRPGPLAAGRKSSSQQIWGPTVEHEQIYMRCMQGRIGLRHRPDLALCCAHVHVTSWLEIFGGPGTIRLAQTGMGPCG